MLKKAIVNFKIILRSILEVKSYHIKVNEINLVQLYWAPQWCLTRICWVLYWFPTHDNCTPVVSYSNSSKHLKIPVNM